MYEAEYEKTKELKQNSFWGIWSRLILSDYPQDSCVLLRHTILAILTLPLWIFPGLLVNGFITLKYKIWDIDYEMKYWYWSLINIIIFFLGLLVIEKGYYPDFYIIYLYGLGVAVGMSFLVSIVFGVIWLGGKIFSYVKYQKYSLPTNQKSMIKIFLRDLKKKHCSLIIWKSDNE